MMNMMMIKTHVHLDSFCDWSHMCLFVLTTCLFKQGEVKRETTSSVVGHRRKVSAQADADVCVQQPLGHQGGVVEVVQTINSLSFL